MYKAVHDTNRKTRCCFPLVLYDFTILRIPLNTKAYTLQKNCERQGNEEAFSDLKQDY